MSLFRRWRACVLFNAGVHTIERQAKLGKAPCNKWEWRQFANPARKDGLKLSHWVKKDEAADKVYTFSKFNKLSRVPDYKRDDYLRLLADDDWSEEETNCLFELCRQFDLRFIVVWVFVTTVFVPPFYDALAVQANPRTRRWPSVSRYRLYVSVHAAEGGAGSLLAAHARSVLRIQWCRCRCTMTQHYDSSLCRCRCCHLSYNFITLRWTRKTHLNPPQNNNINNPVFPSRIFCLLPGWKRF